MLQVKSLLTELDEIRSQREKLGLESDHVHRLQNKQMTEFHANVRAAEASDRSAVTTSRRVIKKTIGLI